jgi:methylaspartate mutase epsilon subunit
MPLHDIVRPAGSAELTAAGLLASLSFVERKFDYTSLEEDLATEIQAEQTAVTPGYSSRETRT